MIEKRLIDLIKIKSVSSDTPKCQEALDYALNCFDEKKCFIKKEVCNGVVSALVSNADTLSLDCLYLIHLDVVPAEDSLFLPVKQDDKLIGRGALDMKSSASIVIDVLTHLFDVGTPLKLGVLFVTDEEVGGSNGARYWADEKKLTSKIVLDLDSSQPIDTLIYRTKKVLMLNLKASGVSAHGSRPWLGIDANEEMMQTICAIRKKYPYYHQENLPENQGWVDTLHVGTIHGGTAMNCIANTCEASLDFRLIETTKITDILDFINQVKSQHVDVNIATTGNGISLDVNNPVVALYKNNVEQVIQSPLIYNSAYGATDGRYFADKSIVLTHQATGGNGHQENEYILLSSMHQLKEIQLSFLECIRAFYG